MKMTDFAVLVNKFIMDYLTSARNMSPNTILSYRDAIVLLLTFMTQVYGIKPERLEITDIDADRVEKFLDWLESERTSSIATRNVRLAEAPSYGMPVNLYDKRSKGALAYVELAKELTKKTE